MSSKPQAKLSVVEQTFDVSFFNYKSDATPNTKSLTWSALVERCRKPAIRSVKDGELFSPALFKGIRKNENVQHLSMLALDYDHDADFNIDLRVWRELGLTFFAYTSHSHLRKTDKNPKAEQRFRVVLPLVVPIPATNYTQLWKWAAEQSDNKIDAAPKALAQMFYLPAKASATAPYKFEEHKGALLDWRTLNLEKSKTRPRSVDAREQVSIEDANLPQAKFDLLLELEPKFRASWERKRRTSKNFKDQSPSSYVISLLNYAALYEWSAEDARALIIEWRRLNCKPEEVLPVSEVLRKFSNHQWPEAQRWVASQKTKSGYASPSVAADNDAKITKSKQARIEEVGLTKALADEICEHNHFALDKGDLLYVYKNGVYLPEGEQFVTRRVKELLNDEQLSKKWTLHRANEVIGYISADAPKMWEEPSPDAINMRNGIVRIDLETGKHEFTDHTHEHLFPVQLPINYKAQAQCEFWEQFIRETFPNDAQEVAYQIPAWLMIPDVSLQKAILLVGEGANGKSTYLGAVRTFIGRRNTSSVSLHKLESNTFAAAQLVGKLANICPDLPSTHLESTSVFKNIVGGDSINVERKGRDSFDVTLYARLVFSANHLPRSKDSSRAFFRRWIVLPFERTFEESEQVSRRILDARLNDPKELSGVFNRALASLPQLLCGGFSESASMVNAHSEFRRTTDPFAMWLERETIEENEHIVPAVLLRTQYNAACYREGRPVMTENSFGRAFNQIKPHIEKKQRMYAAQLQWCYINIGLKNK